MRNHCRSLLPIVVVCSAIAGPVAAGQFGFLKRESATKYTAFKDSAGRFALEYPQDWQVIAGAGDIAVTIAQRKGEAALVVERFKLHTPLAPEEITELFTQIESDVLKERQPQATDVVSKLTERSGQRLIVIDYTRPGLAGPERVRQYSFPAGEALYRVTCSAMTAQFAKYDPVFAHVADSFTLGTAPKTGADN